MLLGAHVSTQGGVANAPGNGVRLGCDVIQIFSKNQRQWAARAYTPAEIEAYRSAFKESGLKACVVHDSYLINLASPDPAMWKKSLDAFLDEAQRCVQLGIPDLVFHPGAHLGTGAEAGVKRIAEAVRVVLGKIPEKSVHLDLETMAGQGSTIGNRLEDLRDVIEAAGEKRSVGVCLDTCHLFAAGFELRTPEGYAATMKRIEATVGIKRVRAFHLNDSKGPLDCRLDRHANIGEGEIGAAGFANLMRDERFEAVPMNLETPGEDPGYVRDLKTLRSLAGRPIVPKAASKARG